MILACASPSADHIEEAREPIASVLIERAHRIIQAKLFDPKFGADSCVGNLASHAHGSIACLNRSAASCIIFSIGACSSMRIRH